MSKGIRLGRSGELRVASELLRHGLDVYSPCAADGGADLIVRVPAAEDIRHFDVVVRTLQEGSRLRFRAPEQNLDTFILVVHTCRAEAEDSFFFLTGEQLQRHQVKGSPFGDLEFTPSDREAYRSQDLTALGAHLRKQLPSPSVREIELAARRYVASELGDAIRVERPVRQGSEWRVDLLNPETGEKLGAVLLDSCGAVIFERSATYASVRGLSNDPAVSAA